MTSTNLNIPMLPEEQKQLCEGEMSLEELKAVLDSFQNNKSPGNDGIPIEFYKVCWDLISDSFRKCVKESYKYGEMSSSQKKAVITLIEKQGKDRTLIENWRPISLIMPGTRNVKDGQTSVLCRHIGRLYFSEDWAQICDLKKDATSEPCRCNRPLPENNRVAEFG